MILDVGKALLQKLGYQVLVAASGRKGLEIYRQNPAKIDLIILDMIMPEMNGGETYERLREIDPRVKVLLSSGYTMDGVANDILKQGPHCFIQKPFDIKKVVPQGPESIAKSRTRKLSKRLLFSGMDANLTCQHTRCSTGLPGSNRLCVLPRLFVPHTCVFPYHRP